MLAKIQRVFVAKLIPVHATPPNIPHHPTFAPQHLHTHRNLLPSPCLPSPFHTAICCYAVAVPLCVVAWHDTDTKLTLWHGLNPKTLKCWRSHKAHQWQVQRSNGRLVDCRCCRVLFASHTHTYRLVFVRVTVNWWASLLQLNCGRWTWADYFNKGGLLIPFSWFWGHVN